MAKHPRAAPFVIPRHVTIRGRRWLVVHEHELDPANHPPDAHAKRDLKSCWGMTRRDLREIHLAHHETPYAEAVTFLHELMHACVRNDVKRDNDFAGPDAKENEERVFSHIDATMLDALCQLEWLPRKRRRKQTRKR